MLFLRINKLIDLLISLSVKHPFVIWNGKNLYLSNLNLYFGGGTDSLTHWGYGKWILESIKNMDFNEAFLGVENVYYYMFP